MDHQSSVPTPQSSLPADVGGAGVLFVVRVPVCHLINGPVAQVQPFMRKGEFATGDFAQNVRVSRKSLQKDERQESFTNSKSHP